MCDRIDIPLELEGRELGGQSALPRFGFAVPTHRVEHRIERAMKVLQGGLVAAERDVVLRSSVITALDTRRGGEVLCVGHFNKEIEVPPPVIL